METTVAYDIKLSTTNLKNTDTDLESQPVEKIESEQKKS